MYIIIIIINFFEDINPFGVGKQFVNNFNKNINIPNHYFIFVIVVIVISLLLRMYDRVVVGKSCNVKMIILIFGPIISFNRRVNLMKKLVMRIFLILNVIAHDDYNFEDMFLSNSGKLAE